VRDPELARLLPRLTHHDHVVMLVGPIDSSEPHWLLPLVSWYHVGWCPRGHLALPLAVTAAPFVLPVSSRLLDQRSQRSLPSPIRARSGGTEGCPPAAVTTRSSHQHARTCRADRARRAFPFPRARGGTKRAAWVFPAAGTARTRAYDTSSSLYTYRS